MDAQSVFVEPALRPLVPRELSQQHRHHTVKFNFCSDSLLDHASRPVIMIKKTISASSIQHSKIHQEGHQLTEKSLGQTTVQQKYQNYLGRVSQAGNRVAMPSRPQPCQIQQLGSTAEFGRSMSKKVIRIRKSKSKQRRQPVMNHTFESPVEQIAQNQNTGSPKSLNQLGLSYSKFKHQFAQEYLQVSARTRQQQGHGFVPRDFTNQSKITGKSDQESINPKLIEQPPLNDVHVKRKSILHNLQKQFSSLALKSKDEPNQSSRKKVSRRQIFQKASFQDFDINELGGVFAPQPAVKKEQSRIKQRCSHSHLHFRVTEQVQQEQLCEANPYKQSYFVDFTQVQVVPQQRATQRVTAHLQRKSLALGQPQGRTQYHRKMSKYQGVADNYQEFSPRAVAALPKTEQREQEIQKVYYKENDSRVDKECPLCFRGHAQSDLTECRGCGRQVKRHCRYCVTKWCDDCRIPRTVATAEQKQEPVPERCVAGRRGTLLQLIHEGLSTLL